MKLLTVFQPNAHGEVILTKIEPDGPPVKAELARPETLKGPLRDIYLAAMAITDHVQIITCRIIGEPEKADGSHLQELLAPGDLEVRLVGMTV